MAQRNYNNQKSTPRNSITEDNGPNGLSPEVADLLGKARQLLDEKLPEKALDTIKRSKLSSPWITNATGVCAMRIGNVKPAAGLFQGLVAHGGIMLKPDAPLVFKTNFATALLASNNMQGCLSVLHEIGDDGNPTVQRLRAAIQQWKQGLSFWQKLKWYTGDVPQKAVALDFPLGELE
jgi:hypothetical protein